MAKERTRPTFKTRVGRVLGAIGLRSPVRWLERRLRKPSFQPASVHNVTAAGVERALEMVAREGGGEGRDYYEFGVYRGYSFLHAQRVADRLGLSDLRFFGFDSFQGLPPVEGPDRYKGDFYESQYTADKEWVEQQLTLHGIDWSRAYLIEGFFEDSLTPAVKAKYRMRPAAVALVDSDLYSSAKTVLRFLADLIADGTLLLFDDWNAFDADPNRGERRAFREFLEEHPQVSAEEVFDFGRYGKAMRLSLAR